MWKSPLFSLAQIPQTRNNKASWYATISTYDGFSDAYCVPGMRPSAREQKEQGLCSNGTSMQREGREERQKINKIISDSDKTRTRTRPDGVLDRMGMLAWGIWEGLFKEVTLELSPE